MRPDGDLAGTVRTVRIPGPDGPEEVRVVLGRDGVGALREGFVHGARGDRATCDALCRLLSLALQLDAPLPDLVRMLRGLGNGCAPVPWPGGGLVVSLPDALARILEAEIPPEPEAAALHDDQVPLPSGPAAPAPPPEGPRCMTPRPPGPVTGEEFLALVDSEGPLLSTEEAARLVAEGPAQDDPPALSEVVLSPWEGPAYLPARTAGFDPAATWVCSCAFPSPEHQHPDGRCGRQQKYLGEAGMEGIGWRQRGEVRSCPFCNGPQALAALFAVFERDGGEGDR